MKQEILLKLNDIMVEMGYSMLNQELRTPKTTTRCSRPVFADKYIALISMGNLKFHGQFVVGFPYYLIGSEHFQELINIADSEDEKEELIHDILGELLNVIAAQYVADNELVDIYGKLTISPPIIWDQDKDTIPRFTSSDGFSGQVHDKDGKAIINIFVTIQKLASHSIIDYNA